MTLIRIALDLLVVPVDVRPCVMLEIDSQFAPSVEAVAICRPEKRNRPQHFMPRSQAAWLTQG